MYIFIKIAPRFQFDLKLLNKNLRIICQEARIRFIVNRSPTGTHHQVNRRNFRNVNNIDYSFSERNYVYSIKKGNKL